jgi:hypothetical protein
MADAAAFMGLFGGESRERWLLRFVLSHSFGWKGWLGHLPATLCWPKATGMRESDRSVVHSDYFSDCDLNKFLGAIRLSVRISFLSNRRHGWIFIICSTIEKASRLTLIYPSPLFEEEGNIVATALAQDLPNPGGI